nr:PREDICTED: GRIP and coiled-coil domain-containing protein 1-like [Bemisia tabaci]
MDVISKKDLIETVTRQEEELKRYKKRFQDVVTAHKNLIKEKEALELSLKIMTDSVGTTKPQPESSATKQEEPSEEEKGTDVPSIEAQDPEGKQSDDSNVALRTQLNKLMKSLSSLSNEKSRMEVCFQTDRKQLRQEKEKVPIFVFSLCIVQDIELHQKLHDECKKREELERSVELKDQREQDLKNQIETLQQKVSKTKAPLLNRLHEEMIAMKQQHMVAIQQPLTLEMAGERFFLAQIKSLGPGKCPVYPLPLPSNGAPDKNLWSKNEQQRQKNKFSG